jgi:lipid-A-disaccharide synthase
MDAKRDAFAASHVALAASGTVTSELTLAGVPMVIVYRLAWLTALVIGLMIKIPHVSVVNLALGREVAPEFLQRKCRADLITGALLPLFLSPDARRKQIEELANVAGIFGGGDETSSQQAAEVILRLAAGQHAAD